MKTVYAAAAMVAALMVVGSGQSAKASDLSARSSPSLFSPAPMSSWNGFYVGLNGGGGWGTTNHTLTIGIPGFSGTSGDFDVGGGLFGATIGYNRQFGPWVFGGEADLDWARIDGSKSFTIPFGGVPLSFSVLSRLEWLDTIRGRVGYMWGPQALLYLTGGAAYGSVTSQVPFAITGFGAGLSGFVGQSDTRLGWTIGVGLEYMLMPQLTGKLEYLYVDLGTNTQLIVDNVKFDTNIFRAGANWHF
jgi:outer membrane immunogenic protein